MGTNNETGRHEMTYTLTAKIETGYANCTRTRTITRTYKGLTLEQVNDGRSVVRMLAPVGSTITFGTVAE